MTTINMKMNEKQSSSKICKNKIDAIKQIQKKMKKLLLLFAFVIGLGSIAHSYENTYAIIIGVADYKNYTSYNGDLNYTINDARKFCEFLRSRQGGSVPASNIILLTNERASKANIIAKAKALFSKAKSNDRVIFYFSGHGSKGCFVPYDVTLCGGNMLYFSEVKAIFRCAKCKTKLLFADSCFSGSMKGLKTKALNETIRKEIKTTSNMNIAVMMSCSGDEVSLEMNDLQQGLFTYYLMEGLSGKANKDNNGYVTIQELFYYVYKKVTKKAAATGDKQTPELFGKFDLRLIVANVSQKY